MLVHDGQLEEGKGGGGEGRGGEEGWGSVLD